MRKKLIISYVFLIISMLLLTTFFLFTKSQKVYIEGTQEELIHQGKLLRDLLQYTDEAELNEFVDEYGEKINLRLTVIDAKDEVGKVLADSEYDYHQMENHQYRKEVKEALNGEVGHDKRYSKTAGINFMYIAMPFNANNMDGIIRLAIPLSNITILASEFIKLSVASVLVTIIFGITIYALYVDKLTQPLSELSEAAQQVSKENYDIKIGRYKEKDFKKLGKAFNHMTHVLNENMEELSKRNTELEAILNSMPNGVIAVDLNYKIILNNQRFLELFEIEEEIAGQQIFDVVRNEALYRLVDELLGEQKGQVEELAINGEYQTKLLKVYTSPIISEVDQTCIGGLIHARDITAINRLENMRKDFVSNVTHELKTPLTSIKGFVDTLKNGALEEPVVARRFLNIIDVESERLYRLIQDILYLSAIENKKEEVAISKVGVHELVSEVFLMLDYKAQEKNIELILEVPEDLTIPCNKDQLKQVFINLVDNGINYTEKGHVKVKATRLSNQDVEVEVLDTGIGIEEQHMDRLFERFYRVDKGRARKVGGTGLGLSIVKHIVEFYNGRIFVKSKLGEGTSISIYFPVEM